MRRRVSNIDRDLQVTIRHPNREQIAMLQDILAEATDTNFVSAGRSLEIASAFTIDNLISNNKETKKFVKRIVNEASRLNSVY